MPAFLGDLRGYWGAGGDMECPRITGRNLGAAGEMRGLKWLGGGGALGHSRGSWRVRGLGEGG